MVGEGVAVTNPVGKGVPVGVSVGNSLKVPSGVPVGFSWVAGVPEAQAERANPVSMRYRNIKRH
jgi:hypothetical protein